MRRTEYLNKGMLIKRLMCFEDKFNHLSESLLFSCYKFSKKMIGISLSNSFTTQSKMSTTTNDFSHRLSLADDFYRFIFGNYILIRMELKALKKALNTC